METILRELASKIEINLNNEQIKKFLVYKELLKEWNKKINLTAITEDNEIILKHFIDSLTILKYVKDNDKVIDVGTGAGFPGIPIKIVKENISLTLLDSLNKRLIFLADIIEKNKLKNVEVVHGRAEEIAINKKYREKYDIATARAVANLTTLSELCMPFVKLNGIFVCMKGNNIETEIKESENAIKILGGKIENIEKVVLPESDIERNIIIIRKIKSTPEKYPRKAPLPTKSPLL